MFCSRVLLAHSEIGGRTNYRLLCRDAGGETEQSMLNETVPPWVYDIAVQVCTSMGLCVPPWVYVYRHGSLILPYRFVPSWVMTSLYRCLPPWVYDIAVQASLHHHGSMTLLYKFVPPWVYDIAVQVCTTMGL